MEKRVRVFGILDILLGITMIITQYAAIVMFSQPVDTVSSGLWGGLCVMVTGVLVIKRANVMVLAFSILSTMSGLLMICLYIWSFSLYGDIISSGYDCDTPYMGHSVCSRIALDSLFIIYGVAALSMNTILIHDAKWIEPKTVNDINPLAGNSGPASELRNIPIVVRVTPTSAIQNQDSPSYSRFG